MQTVPDALGPWLRRIALAGLPFAVAFAADLATDRRYSMYLGSAAILLSLLALSARARSLATPIGAYVAIWLGFNALRAVADDTPWSAWALGAVASTEQTLAGGTLPGVELQGLRQSGVAAALDLPLTAVYLSYFVAPHIAALWLLSRMRRDFWRYAVASGLLFFVGLVGFALLPTAPPWQTSGDIERVVHTLLGGEGASPAYAFDPNPVASMPSIHLGVSALLIPLARRGTWRAAATVYTGLMGIALVYLGEHYVLDVLAGAMAAWLAWRAAGAIQRPRPRVLTEVNGVSRMRVAARRIDGVADGMSS